MKRFGLIFILLIPFLFTTCNNKQKSNNQTSQNVEFAIVIHGGAGDAKNTDIAEDQQTRYKQKLQEALDTGVQMLKEGKSSVDVVESVIHILENSPLFNAGKGAVFTHKGTNELDASIMCGKDLNAGAVAGVGDIKHPISAAKKVMENSEHVMLAGKGASQFAKVQNLEIVDSSYFYTERRWKSLQKYLKDKKYGTVGCVVLDKKGNLAAGTSTGGRTNKKYGRIGDSPIIGAGTYANNNTCAISATGHGEFFIRYTVAHDISALMEYKKLTVKEAAHKVIREKLVKAGGKGGIIGVDKKGNIVMSYNTNMMFRAYQKSTGEKGVHIFGKKTEK